MKITIEENDKDEAERILSYSKSLSLIWDIDQRCREICKYGEPSKETEKILEEIRNMIAESNLMEIWR